VPLTRDQLLELDNIAAERPMPAVVAERLARWRHYVSVADPKIDLAARLKRHGEQSGVWEMDLPSLTTVGLPGRTGKLVSSTDVSKTRRGKGTLGAFRPPWADQVFHPKLTGPRAKARLRALDGGRIEPTDNVVGVYGNDERAIFPPAGYPWQCIGKVITWRDPSREKPTGFGTGVLVGRRHVLTAGHVAPWGSSPWMMQFIPGSWDGQSLSGPGAMSYVSDFRSFDGGALKLGARDLSLLRLYEPLGDTLGYFGAKVFTPGPQEVDGWKIVGYPTDVSEERPSFQAGIEVVDQRADGDFMELRHYGDATRGDSGGPFFGMWPDRFPYVIGAVSGTLRQSGGNQPNVDINVCAGGRALVNLIAYWREHWP
jgi:V8-like Glu-specific endopeptidase